jgi:hypothetical protein
MNKSPINQQLNTALSTLNTSDDTTPLFAFSTTSTVILVAFVNKVVNADEVIMAELKARGLDINGNWIGFGK